MILEIWVSVYKGESECRISSPPLLGKSLKLKAKGEMDFANRPPEKMCVRLCIVQEAGRREETEGQLRGRGFMFAVRVVAFPALRGFGQQQGSCFTPSSPVTSPVPGPNRN